jgi:hypothetical protein
MNIFVQLLLDLVAYRVVTVEQLILSYIHSNVLIRYNNILLCIQMHRNLKITFVHLKYGHITPRDATYVTNITSHDGHKAAHYKTFFFLPSTLPINCRVNTLRSIHRLPR